MSAANVTIRYDGPALATHRMDIADIAPALLGISELCKIANKRFNGERASVKVLIGTDSEHQCFQLDLHVVQSLWDHTKSVLSNDEVKSAKEFLEWLGLITSSTGVALGLFAFVKRLGDKKVTSTTIEEKDGRDVVRVTIDGDHNNVVIVHPAAMEMLKDDAVLANAKKVVQPLTREGYDTVEFESRGKVQEVINKEEAYSISNIAPENVRVAEIDKPQMLTAWITVYSPVYDIKAPLWRFKFGDSREYMDISETDIAYAALKRGGAMVDDAYRVELEITQEHKPEGGITNHYKVKRVIDFKPARVPHQSDAFKE